jgi:hypothetical protein
MIDNTSNDWALCARCGLLVHKCHPFNGLAKGKRGFEWPRRSDPQDGILGQLIVVRATLPDVGGGYNHLLVLGIVQEPLMVLGLALRRVLEPQAGAESCF